MTQFHPSLRGPCRRAPKISLEALEAPPLPASSLLLPVQEAQQSPDQSTTPCHRIPMGKALPLPPPHMSEGWPPWALHPCYLRGGGRWLAFQMCLANRTRKDSGRGGDRRKHGNITLKPFQPIRISTGTRQSHAVLGGAAGSIIWPRSLLSISHCPPGRGIPRLPPTPPARPV